MATHFTQSGIAAVSSSAPAGAVAGEKRYLIGPVTDFLCFGGASLIIMPLLLLLPVSGYRASVAVVMMLVANFINHPHFAHSYQIFYRGFRAKAFTATLGRVMQIRYLFAGILAPALLVAFLAFCIAAEDVRLLGYAGNAMGFFVGWHYVKQGYGMLMVDATLKRQFFAAPEKKLLLVNSYAVWAASWTAVNDIVASKESWGIHFFSFDMPDPIVGLALAAALGTSVATAAMLFSRWRSTGALPVNGVIAYFVSLYPWLAFVGFNPLWLLVVPALHSLQYLAVVWRFQTNFERAQLSRPEYKAGSIARRTFGSNPFGHLAIFILVGTVLGFCGFWYFPSTLNTLIPHDKAILGGTAFIFAAWIFINVHHYFIDNVMWRRENPDTKRYLFD